VNTLGGDGASKVAARAFSGKTQTSAATAKRRKGKGKRMSIVKKSKVCGDKTRQRCTPPKAFDALTYIHMLTHSCT
jgi:hypothetical protein